jgi:outer membrane lipoprotein-sorting protein
LRCRHGNSLKAATIEGEQDFSTKDLNSATVIAAQKQEEELKDTKDPTDGLKVMTAVSERDRGDDYVITISWVFTKKGRVITRMKFNEKRKNYRGKNGFLYKSVIRYTHPPNIGRRAFVTWNYKDRQKTYWYYLDNMTVGERTSNVDFLKPPAESDFSIMDYVDINLEEETHRLLKSEKYEDTICYVVESSPLKKHIKYGKRVSWIDQDNWIPLKIDYFDRSGKLWKTLNITWQNKDGLWFWKKAEVENAQNDNKTFIIIEDVKVNVGLNEREFTKVALGRKKF